MSWFYYTIDHTIEQVFFLFLCNSSPTCRGELLLYYVKITLISSFVNMSVRVIFAAILVFHFSLQIEALPFSYLAGWIGMLVAEIPLLLKKF